MNLEKLGESFIPFKDPNEFGIAIRMLDLLLRQENLNIFIISRLNVFCLDNLENCLSALLPLKTLLKKVTLTVRIDSLKNVDLSKIINLHRELGMKRLIIYYNSFVDVYNNLKSISNISSVVPVSLLTKLENVLDDLEFLTTINRLNKNIYLGFLLGSPNDILRLPKNIRIQLLCRKTWLLNEIITARSEPQNPLIKPVYFLIPSEKLRILGILKSGIKIISKDNVYSVNSKALKEFVLSYVYSNPLSQKASLFIGIKLGKDVIISEEDLEVLSLIKKYGCLKKVAEILGSNYATIRKKLIDLEKELETKIIISQRGGSEKGSTVLSPLGEELLVTLKPIIDEVKRILSQHDISHFINLRDEICKYDFID